MSIHNVNSEEGNGKEMRMEGERERRGRGKGEYVLLDCKERGDSHIVAFLVY